LLLLVVPRYCRFRPRPSPPRFVAILRRGASPVALLLPALDVVVPNEDSGFRVLRLLRVLYDGG
jgi:hypothetical protein